MTSQEIATLTKAVAPRVMASSGQTGQHSALVSQADGNFGGGRVIEAPRSAPRDSAVDESYTKNVPGEREK